MEKTPTANEHWLVRTVLNELRGPYSRNELVQEIHDGKLGPQDEVCRSGSYWIYLDERDEVRKQLGIEPPRGHLSLLEEEQTDTKTEHLTQEIDATARASIELPELFENVGPGDTTILANRSLRRFDPNKPRADRRSYQKNEAKPMVLGKREQPYYWRIMISVLIIFTGILVAWVIRVLQTS